jgi:hypothetical protein
VFSGHSKCFTSDIKWHAESKTIFVSDMHEGTLRKWKPPLDWDSKSVSAPVLLTEDSLVSKGKSNCRFEFCDWNRDGIQDFIQAELGSNQIGDHHFGRVSMIFGKQDGTYETFVVASDLSRVVRAIPFDYDEDGDQDLLVADFGWFKTGEAASWCPLAEEQGGPNLGEDGIRIFSRTVVKNNPRSECFGIERQSRFRGVQVGFDS